ncbi:hypothetical protein AA309_17415 [Microvirga vignae]|uniref:Transcriptional regulator, AbiEi antitoxin, Type IV TA system n=1 Tax=Microvirga vignae TaxID=1225564 RepID=A0A0H1RA09_9HYPH|nr:DUF6088 family protein [Microvirga vignae]KLK91884.1 hypothetical protein AA309_17415 [Microvirga vignae]
MKRLTSRILEEARRLPEGAVLTAKALLHLSSRAAVDQALSRLARRGQLLRAGRGLYVLPVESRFGVRAPSVEKVVEAVAAQRGETIAPNGAAAANALGLSTQVPVRRVYLTSGPSRTLHLGRQTVELKHAPQWQLVLPGRPAGQAVRALAWLGPAKVYETMRRLKRTLPVTEWEALTGVGARLPTWLAEPVSQATHG